MTDTTPNPELETTSEPGPELTAEPKVADVAAERIRITFGKVGALKYIGHLDVAKMWERVLRRARIRLAYSQGYNARPRMQFAAPLPLGITSECEVLDVWLAAVPDLEALVAHLAAVSPSGLVIYRAERVPEKSRALQTLVNSAVYRITLPDTSPDAIRARVAQTLAAESLPRTRRDKAYDLRPLIVGLRVDEDGTLWAELIINETGSGRPDEVIAALGLDAPGASIHRAAIKLRGG